MSDFLNYRNHQNEEDLELKKLEGHIRALEALILEMPGTNPDLIRAAKASLRKKFKNSFNREVRATAELKDLINAPYDEHAEGALDRLAGEAESKKL